MDANATEFLVSLSRSLHGGAIPELNSADVVNAKMDLAKTILWLESKPTLAEVAERLGYKSTQHFIA